MVTNSRTIVMIFHNSLHLWAFFSSQGSNGSNKAETFLLEKLFAKRAVDWAFGRRNPESSFVNSEFEGDWQISLLIELFAFVAYHVRNATNKVPDNLTTHFFGDKICSFVYMQLMQLFIWVDHMISTFFWIVSYIGATGSLLKLFVYCAVKPEPF